MDVLTELLLYVTALWTFVETEFIPADAASTTALHFFIWGGSVLSLLGGTFATIRRAIGSGGGR